MSFLDRWKKFAKILGKIQTVILMFVIYFIVCPLFSFVRFSDPLRKKLKKDKQSYWEEYHQKAFTLENYYRLS